MKQGDNVDGSAIECGAAGEWDEAFVGWPTVLNHQQREFRMYYSSWSAETKKFMIGIATSQDGLKFKKKGQGPVFSGGPEGSWDSGGIYE